MAEVIVLDAAGQRLSACSPQKARKMLAEGRAKLVSKAPFTIQLPYGVSLKQRPLAASAVKPGEGRRLLLHICCGPCSTYSIKRLQEQGFEVTGFWYNPNIHPFAEHERRRECAGAYAQEIGLPMIWGEGYEMPAYFRAVAGHEVFGERCAICYELRLKRTAEIARQLDIEAFTTTLLISPYQQQAAICQIGENLARQYGLEFYFENLRKGWGERGQMAREHNLYQQSYCGCLYSEWERSQQQLAGRTATKARHEQQGET
jgi:predicted adenine nucleotide alpha hydrolase (AANH) superfamily ATPase